MSTELSACMVYHMNHILTHQVTRFTEEVDFMLILYPCSPSVAPAGRGWVSQPSQKDSQRDRLADLVTMGACIGGDTENTNGWEMEYWMVYQYICCMLLQWRRETSYFCVYNCIYVLFSHISCILYVVYWSACKSLYQWLELHWGYITTSTHMLAVHSRTGGIWSWDCLKD